MITITTEDTKFGEIRVLRNRLTGAHVYVQDGYSQSEADSDGISLTPYIHAMFGLLAQTTARRVLMLGCGGGTLATMLAKANRKVTMVEINPASIALARRYFALPPEITCYVDDGDIFLRRRRDIYDAIVVDAFTGGSAPTHLCSPRFFKLARRRLATSGCLLINVMVDHDFDDSADVMAAGMAGAGFAVHILDMPGRRFRNAIAIGGAVPNLSAPRLVIRPNTSCDEIERELGRLRFRRWRPDRSWPPLP